MNNQWMTQEFRQRFEAEMKTVNCRELTGADLTTPEGIDEFMNSDIPKIVCFPTQGLAFNIVMDILKKYKNHPSRIFATPSTS